MLCFLFSAQIFHLDLVNRAPTIPVAMSLHLMCDYCFLYRSKMDYRWTNGRQETGGRDRRQSKREQVIDVPHLLY